MVTGFATFAGSAAVAFAAWFGALQWRAQKISEFQMDVARDILKSVYELEDCLNYVLSDVCLVEEQKKYEVNSAAQGARLSETDRSIVGRILFDRLMHINSSVLSVRSKRVDARLSFGTKGWEKLHAIHDLVVEIQAAASILVGDEVWHASATADYWAKFFPAEGETGYVGMIKAAVLALEHQLIPVVGSK
jgi:hypothetical protein